MIPIPYFMSGFILDSAYMGISKELTDTPVFAAYLLLSMAMAALVINVNFEVIAKRGIHPFCAPFLASLLLLVFVATLVKFFVV